MKSKEEMLQEITDVIFDNGGKVSKPMVEAVYNLFQSPLPIKDVVCSSDAVDFLEWCVDKGYVNHSDFMPYYGSQNLYQMFNNKWSE